MNSRFLPLGIGLCWLGSLVPTWLPAQMPVQNYVQYEDVRKDYGTELRLGGVLVDSKGELRLREVNDPGGELLKKRKAAAQEALSRDVARSSPLRKVSLNRLEAALAKRLANNERPTPEMRCLAGLTRLTHVFLLPESNDIVFAGPAEGFVWDVAERPIGLESGQPLLELQDLIVALRTFPPTGNAPPVIGVSIDPTAEGHDRMNQFLIQVGTLSPGRQKQVAEGIRKALGPSVVSVHGVSPKTHFTQVMLEADYRLKLIAVGALPAPANLRSFAARASVQEVAIGSMQRFFFEPSYDALRITDDQLALEFVNGGVRVVAGEHSARGADGQVRDINAQGIGSARDFARQVTEKYAEVAKKLPVFDQLRNILDLTVAAAYVREFSYYTRAKWKAEVFGREAALAVELFQAPALVEPGVTYQMRGKFFLFPVGGVVVRPVKVLQDARQHETDGKLSNLRRNLYPQAIAEGNWWWD